MGELNYFFDTYALHKISQGDSSYASYTKDVNIATTRLNLMELYYGYIARGEMDTAETLFGYFKQFCVRIDDETVKEAMRERSRLKKNTKGCNVSYVDCIGYIVARKLNLRFLTGDKEFEGLENVEFVK